MLVNLDLIEAILSDSWIRSRGQTTSATEALANTSGLEVLCSVLCGV